MMLSQCGCGRLVQDLREHALDCVWVTKAREKIQALSKDDRLTVSKLLDELKALKERAKWTPNSGA